MSTQTTYSSRSMPRRLASLFAIASLGLLGITSSAQAGIDIRAPFTHVGVDRHNGINVAAPFTRLNIGGHRHRGHHYDRRYDRRVYRHHRDWRRDRRAYREYRARRDYERYRNRERDRGFFGRW